MIRRARRDGRDEHGFVLVFVALCMTFLLLCAGFAVDLGSFYREGTQLQRAVDAAALAGVIYMPNDLGTATATATTTLAKNNVVDGVGGMSVSVTTVPGNNHRLKVCATDRQVPTYFTSVMHLHPVISKCATAEYQLPVPMGSPFNEMDANALGGVDLAINGYCAASEDGDQINSRYRAMFTNGTTYTGCPPGSPNNALYYDSSGYVYAVDVTDTSQTVTVEINDAAFNPTSSGLDRALGDGTTGSTDTIYKITDGTLTPLDPTDDPPFGPGTVTARSGDAAWTGWHTLFTIPAGSRPGRYRIHITTSTNSTSFGENGFDLRARVGSTFTSCSSDPNDAAIYRASCPQVFAEQHLGVYARAAGSTAVFPLASIDPSYAGHHLSVDLWDPGEGGQTIELLGPDGNPVSFTYTTPDTKLDASLTPYSGSGSALDVSGTTTPLPGRKSGSKFNERLVELTVNLPSDYATRYAGKTWWKLRYHFASGGVTDRTTWSIAVSGDPVRLVDGR